MNWILKNKKTPVGNAPNEGERKRKNISQGGKTKTLLMVLFLASSVMFFGGIKNAAASCTCQVKQADGTTQNQPAAANTGPAEADCSATCLGANNSASYSWNGGAFKIATAPSAATGLASSVGTGSLQVGNVSSMGTANVNPNGCGLTLDITCYFKEMLVGVLNLVGFIFAIAATLFAWVVNPDNISGSNGMLNKQAVLDVWVMVRDLLNMTFILILLFAAFCTIFQVDKWNLKKVWLNILINALLVNFSFPIARFFIDISNVAFYYFLNHLFTASASGTPANGSTIFASFGDASNIGNLLAPGNYSTYSVAYLMAMIVVVFIMGMTLMVIAALFMVRLIALTMIVMFSPIGFVGYIFPSTSGYADKWWKNLFSYSFFAPIMIFIMAIALRITTAMGQQNMQSFVANANSNATQGDANWISQAAFLSIPIIILWMGMGMAKSFGIAGADTVVSSVKKGGKWLASNPTFGLGSTAWKYSGIPGGTKKGWENARKSGKIFGIENGITRFALKSGKEHRENLIAGGIGNRKKGWDTARMTEERTQANTKREDWKKAGGASREELDKALASKDKASQMAAALEMAEKNGFKESSESMADGLARYKTAMEALKGDAVLKNLFDDKVGEKHIVFKIQAKLDEHVGPMRPEDVVSMWGSELDKLGSDGLAKQKNLHNQAGMHDYLRAKLTDPSLSIRDRQRNAQRINKAAEKMSQTDREAWRAGGIPV